MPPHVGMIRRRAVDVFSPESHVTEQALRIVSFQEVKLYGLEA